MDIRGYQVDPQPSDDNESGFATTVKNKAGVVRGPFKTINAAIACAHAWAEEEAMADLKAIEDAAPVPAPESNDNPVEPETKE